MKDHGWIDKRKSKRFHLKNGSMAAITPHGDPTHYYRFGRIVDISLDGLAFEYENNSDLDEGIGIVDLIGLKKSCFIKDLPFNVVYRFIQGKRRQTIRCGLQFGELSDKQLAQLKLLIRNYAIAA